MLPDKFKLKRLRNKVRDFRTDEGEWGKKDKTRALVFRNRGGEDYVPDPTYAQRYVYDDLPNVHKLETGEETKAAPLKAVHQTVQENEDVHVFEAPDSDKVFVGKKIPKDGLFQYDRAGNPMILLAEPEDGQFVPFSFKEKEVDGEYDGDEDPRRRDGEGIVPYLIDNLDERVNMVVKHAQKDKYKSTSILARRPGLTIAFATAISTAIIMVAAGQSFGGVVDKIQVLGHQLKMFNQNFADFASSMASSSGGAPPGG